MTRQFVRLILLVLTSIAACLALADANATITTNDARVKGLHWVGGTSPGHKATWTFHSGPVPGWDPMYLRKVTWSVDDVVKKVSDVDDDTGELPSGAYDFTYTAIGVGKHTVKVQVDYYYSPGPGTVTIAAIGGPLATGVFAGDYGSLTPQRDPGSGSQPFYIQYLGYTYTGSASKPDPSYSQTPQTGSASPAFGQLSTTKYTWSVVGNGIVVPPNSDTMTSAQVSASGSSGVGSIRAKCKFSYVDSADSTLSGEAYDDTEELPNSIQYRFTAHLPSTTGHDPKPPSTTPGPVNGPGGNVSVDPNGHGAAYNDIMYLKDHLGQRMPGVAVTERFSNFATEIKRHAANATSADFTVAQPGDGWITVGNGLFGRYVNSSWQMNEDHFSTGALPWPSDPLQVPTWPHSSHNSPEDPFVLLHQTYVAGTLNTDPSKFGINVGDWIIKMWTDWIEHN